MSERVYKRELSDGTTRWDAVVHIPDPTTGKRKAVQKTFKTQREARKWVADQQGAVNNGTAVLPNTMTVAQLLDYWLEHHVRHHKSGKTYVSYEGTVRLHINPTLGHVQVQKLTVAQVQQWQTRKRDAGCGARTVQLAHINLSQALDVAVKLDLVARNVASLANPPRYQPREMECWTAEEGQRFMAVAHRSVYGPIWQLALVTGMRKGELLGLRWGDVDFDAGVLHVRQTVGALHGKTEYKKPKTARSRRDIDLGDGILAALRAHKRHQLERRLERGPQWQDHDLVFPSTNGTPVNPDNCDLDFNKLVKLAGVKRIRIHDTRHSYATLAILNGIPINVVSQSMGHGDVSTTLRTYAHIMPEQHQELARKMDSLLLRPGVVSVG